MTEHSRFRIPDPRLVVLVVLVGGNFAQLGARLLLSPLVPAILETFAISKSEIGLAFTGMWATYALFQFPSGLLADRIGQEKVIVTALALTGLGNVLISQAPGFKSFTLLVIFLGVGTGLYLSVAGSLLTELFDREGQVLGFVTAGGAFAGLVAPIVASAVVSVYDWRMAIFSWSVLPFVVCILFAVSFRRSPMNDGADSRTDTVDVGAALSLLRWPGIRYTILLASVTMFTWQAFAAFLPTFYVEYVGLSTTDGGFVFGVFFLLSALCQPILGRVSDRFGRDAVLIGCMVLAATSVAGLLSSSTWLSVVVLSITLGIGTSWAGVVQARFMDLLPGSNRGSGFGLVRTSYLLVGSLGSVVTGNIADIFGWTAALGLIVIVLVFGSVLIGVNHVANWNL